MIVKQVIFLIFGLTCLIITILFVGQFYDPDDGDRTLFIKHKPALKQYFYSPVGHYRFHPQKLTLAEEIEEKMFQEFRKDMVDNALPILIILLIQAILTLLGVSFFSFFFNKNLKYWQIPTHFILNMIITAFGVLYLVHSDTFIITLITSFLLLTINSSVIILLDKFNLRMNKLK